ncbi:hypothetical protein AB0I77_49120 [Streptomyces sp. NPDC050619]|uniref:hypothetical protein n=1 Tax=Streptomyces sp. NPDC050619 TaxID=3157214 RepID=UPI00342395F5
MRKRLALVAASVLAAVGVGLAMASPASAENFGAYKTQAECEAAKSARSGVNSLGEPLSCGLTTGDEGAWVLADNRGGG